MTVTMQQVLDTFADGLAESDFAAELRDELAERSRAQSVGLTVAERRFLADEGVAVEHDADPSHSVHRAASDIIGLAAASWSVPEVAALLDVDASRIRHRIADRSLYAFKVGRQLRLPRWQFTGTAPPGPLPGLRTVLMAAGEGASPIELARFVTTPQPDLELAGSAVTPRDWLLAGQDAASVRRILEDLYEW